MLRPALLALTVFSMTMAALADPPPPKCEGPADLCAQVVELRKQLSAQKAADLQGKSEAVKAEAKAADDRTAQRAVKLAGAAAVIAVILKMLLSALGGWKEYFTTTKGQAWLRIITLMVGFVAFVATNLGLGIAWWQALIVAAGGPGAILVHETMKIVPALRGVGPLPSEAAVAEAATVMAVGAKARAADNQPPSGAA